MGKDAESETYDVYYEEIDDLQAWITDNLDIELDDMGGLILDLTNGLPVDITNYI